MFLGSHTRQLVQFALAEDIGRGDCTTDYIVKPGTKAEGTLLIKESARVAGLPLVEYVFHAVDPDLIIHTHVADGFDVEARMAVCTVTGSAASILQAERTALNFLARLCGIATGTRAAVRLLSAYDAQLLDTRKTTPGWRSLEKYAVAIGGGHNHRFGLDDMVLIKDNHIEMAGGIEAAIRLAQVSKALSQKIEVEVDTLPQLDIALGCAVDMILLDNMDLETLKEAVARTNGRVPLEASGNMTRERLRDVAATGVNYISMGALTHAAQSIDVSLDLKQI